MNLIRPLLVLLCVSLFLWLGWTGGAANVFDRSVVTHFADVRHDHATLTQAAVLLTQLGGAWVTLPLAAVAALWLFLTARRRHAAALIMTVATGRLLADGTKLLYDRARPAIDLHPVMTNSSSFPSGHAANSMVAYVAIALFAVPARHRLAAATGAILLSAAIAFTRPFLGVHWPSDMMGGWALAAAVLLTAVKVAHRLVPPEEKHQIVGRHPPLIDEG